MKKSKNKKGKGASVGFDWVGVSTLMAILIITILGYPHNGVGFTKGSSANHGDGVEISLQEVWYYGWITAVSTGLGIIPFFFVHKPNKYWMGVSNGKSPSTSSPLIICV